MTFVLLVDDSVKPRTVRSLVITTAVIAVLAFAFGVVALAWPAVTLFALALAFGFYAMVSGVMLVVAAIRRWTPNRVSGALLGLFDLVAGLIAVSWPGVTVLALTVVVGAWLLATGAVELVSLARAGRAAHRAGLIAWPALRALAALVFGALVLAWPVAGAFGVALLVGLYALIHGGVLGAFSWQLHRLDLRWHPRPTDAVRPRRAASYA